MNIIIAGGGTGGHLFPGIAIAQEMKNRYPDAEIHFIGTERGLEYKVIPDLGFQLHLLKVSGLYKVGIRKKILGAFRLAGSLLDSIRLIKKLKPDLVIGVGGYASGPALLAALFLGVKTVVQEQNAYPGMTNRYLGKKVNYAYVPFEGMEQVFSRPIVVGNPIRKEILNLRNIPDNRRNDIFTLVIFGGSQGARILNQTLSELAPELEPFKEKIRILHQTGPRDKDMVEKAYKAAGLNAETVEFIQEMDTAYQNANLIICRAGSSVHEIVAAGRASILVPIPWASGDHQRQNALKLQKAKAGIMIEEKQLTPQSMLMNILSLFNNREQLREMEQKAAGLFHGNAAEMIVDHLKDNLLSEK